MFIDIMKNSFKNIIRKPGRSLLTIIGISIGVASVVIIGNISNCGTVAVSSEISSLGLGGVSISSDFGRNSIISMKELNLICKVKGVNNAMPVIVRNSEILAHGTISNAIVWGIDSNADKIISLKPIYGRNINKSDVKCCRNVCMVDQNFSKCLYKRDNIVGKKISISTENSHEDYEIIGIVKTGSGLLQNVLGDYIPNFVYIPYSTIQNFLGTENFDQIAVKVNEDANVDVVGNNIIKVLEKESGQTGGYKANNIVKQKDGLIRLMNIITFILSAVGAISLVVASLSIMTVMLVSVNERKREIGIKKSLGAKRKTIMTEFLLESLLITVFGSILGIIIGFLISYIGALIFKTTLSARLDIILIAMLFSIFTGTLFGVYPAFKASKLNPVDALKNN